MTPTAPLPTAFFQQNHWANLRLLEACRGLEPVDLDATVEGTFGTIRDTLRHIVASEAAYAYRLGGPDHRLRPEEPWPGFDRAAEILGATTQAFIDAAERPADGPVRTKGADTDFDTEPEVILVQMFHHSTEHRAQINTILGARGLEVPELSAWQWGIETNRHRPVDHPTR